MQVILEANPQSPYYEPVVRVGDSPTSICIYMLARQKQEYGETIEDHISLPILTRHCKLLQQKYPSDLIQRGIDFALQVSEYPFSFKFVSKLIEEF